MQQHYPAEGQKTNLSVTTATLSKLSTWLFSLAFFFGSLVMMNAQSIIAAYGSSNMPTASEAADVEATALSRGAGLMSASGATFNSDDWTTTAVENDAVTNDDYIQWQITADQGFVVDISEIDIRYDRSPTGPSQIAIRTSLDNFASNIYTDNAVSASGTDANISSLSLTSSVGGVIIFRLYGYDASSSGGTFDIETLSTVGNTFGQANAGIELTGTITEQASGFCPDTIWMNDNSIVGDVYTGGVGSDANAGSKNFPVRTLQRAIFLADSCGVGVIMADVGYYPEAAASSISSGNLTINGPNMGQTGCFARSNGEANIDFSNIPGSSNHITSSTSGQLTIDGVRFMDTLQSTSGPSRIILLITNTSGNPIVANTIFSRDIDPANVIVGYSVTSRGITVSSVPMGNSMTIQDNLFQGTGDTSAFGTLFSGGGSFTSGIYSNGGPGSTVITNNCFNRNRTGINLDDATSGVLVDNNQFEVNGTALAFGGVTPTVDTLTFSGNNFIDSTLNFLTFFNLSNVGPGFYLDATDNTNEGVAFSDLTLNEHFTMESQIVHGNNTGKNGLVRVKENQIYNVPIAVDPRKGVVQRSENIAWAGDTVNLDTGLFAGQVVIDKDLAIIGQDSSQTIIQGVASMDSSFTTSGPNFPVIFAHDADNVLLQDLQVDGDGQGNTNARYFGIAYNNAGGSVLDVMTIRTRNTPLSGAQHGNGIFMNAASGTARSVDVRRSCVLDFQKTGVIFAGSDLTITMDSSLVVGQGPVGVPLAAQNGIQTFSTAMATITNNTVSDIDYTPASFIAAGMLILGDDSAYVAKNLVQRCEVGIYGDGGVSEVFSNELDDGDVAIRADLALATAFFTSSTTVRASNNAITNYDIGYTSDTVVSGETLISSFTQNSVLADTISIRNRDAMEIDGTCNWYGTVEQDSIENLIVGPVDFIPYLVDGTDQMPMRGFQPNSAACTGGLVIADVDSINDVDCFGDSTGSICIAVTNGLAPFQVSSTLAGSSFSTMDTAFCVGNLPAGSDTIVIVDSTGATDTVYATVNQSDSIQLSAIVTDVVGCFNDSTNNGAIDLSVIGGVPPYTYMWSNGDTVQDIDSLLPGDYIVVVTDTLGCTATDTFTVGQPDSLVVGTSQTNVTCNGDNDGTITAMPMGGTPGYTYMWSNGETTQTIGSLMPGAYTVMVTDTNGCMATSDTVFVTQPDPLVVSGKVTQVAGCFGDSTGAINLTVLGGTPFIDSNGVYSELRPFQDIQFSGQDLAFEFINAPNPNSNAVLTVIYQGDFGSGGETVSILGEDNAVLGTTVPTGNDCESDPDTATFIIPQAILASYAADDTITLLADNSNSVDAFCAFNRVRIGLEYQANVPVYEYMWSNGDSTQDLENIPAGVYVVTVSDSNGCDTVVSAVVNQPAELLVTATTDLDATECGGGMDGQVNAMAMGGTPPYSYYWSSGDSTATVDSLAPGTYVITVTDFNGCTALDSTVVDLIDSLKVTATTDVQVACFGDSTGAVSALATDGSAPYSYMWNTGDTTASVSNLPAGTYFVTVTDARGCMVSDTTVITQPTELMASAITTKNVSCNGEFDGTVFASAMGGTPPYSFLWSNGAMTQQVVGVGAGTYFVKVTDANGCMDFDTTVVTQPNALVLSGNVTDVVCKYDSTGAIDLMVMGGTPPFTYMWSNGDTIQDLMNLPADTFMVTVTDSNGCQEMATFIISQPDSLLTPRAYTFMTACVGDSNGGAMATASGGVPPYTYLWSTGDTTQSISGLLAGTYTLTVTDALGCTKTDTALVTDPNPIVITGAVSDALCNGDTNGAIDVSVSGGTAAGTIYDGGRVDYGFDAASGQNFDFSFTNLPVPTSGAILALTFNGDFSDISEHARVISENGAVLDSAGDRPDDCLPNDTTLNIAIPLDSLLAWNADDSIYFQVDLSSNVDAFCFDQFVQLKLIFPDSSAPMYTYMWSTGDTTQDLDSLTAGSYTLTVTDGQGCTNSKTFNVGEPDPLMTSGVVANVACNSDSTGAIDLSVMGGTPFDTSSIYTDTSMVMFPSQPGDSLTFQFLGVPIPQGGGILQVIASGTTFGPDKFDIYDEDSVFLDSTGISGVCGVHDTLTIPLSQSTLASYAANGSIEFTAFTRFTYFGACSQPDVQMILTYDNDSVSQPFYSYMWSTGDTTEDLSGLPAGIYDVKVTDANGCMITDTFTIIENDSLTLNFSTTDAACNGDSTGSASVSVSGGTAPYTYLWSTGATTQMISGVPAGTYDVTVTDSLGCSSMGSATVGEPDSIMISGTVTDVACNGDSTGAIDIEVMGGTPVLDFLPLVVYNNARPEQVVVQPGQNNTFTFANTPTPSSVGVLKLAFQGNYGDPGETVEVRDENGVVLATTVPKGANECGGTPDTLVVNIPLVDLMGYAADSTITFVAGNSNTILPFCVNNINQMTLTFESGGTASGVDTSYQYLWSTGDTTQDVNGLVAGTYSVKVTDANGCMATDTFVVNEPTLLVVGAVVDSNVTCNGGSDGGATVSASGGTPGYTYMWSNSATTASIAGVMAGTYTVVVTDSNGCSDTASVTITEPAPIVVMGTVTDVACNGDSTGTIDITSVAGGTPGYTYMWSSGQTTADISNLPAGQYVLTTTDTNGCMVMDTFMVNEPPALLASSVSTDISCNGANDGSIDAMISGGTPPYSYLWSTGDTVQDLDSLSAGIYTLIVTDANGCSDSVTDTIAEPNMLALSLDSVVDVLCKGDSTGAIYVSTTGGTMPYSYAWSNGDATEDLTNVVAGTYCLVITDANGCQDSICATITQPALALTVDATTVQNQTCDSANGIVTAVAMGGDQGGTPYDVSLPFDTLTQPSQNFTFSFTGATPPSGDGILKVLAVGDLDNPLEFYSIIDENFDTVGITQQTLVQCDTADTLIIIIPQADLAAYAANGTIQFQADGSPSIDTVCQGSVQGVEMSLSYLAGATPYEYVWNTGDTTQTVDSLMAGKYWVKVTDNNGCMAFDTTIVTGPADITVTGNGVAIPDGQIFANTADSTDFGVIPKNEENANCFWISNTGNESLFVDGGNLSGGGAVQFDLTTLPMDTIAPGDSAKMVITYAPKNTGTHFATVELFSNACSADTFTFAVRGEATPICVDSYNGRDSVSGYSATLAWDIQGSNQDYLIQIYEIGNPGNGKSKAVVGNNFQINTAAPGTYIWEVSTKMGSSFVNPSCLDTFTIVCPNITFDMNVQQPDNLASGGGVRVFNVQNGKPLYDFIITDGGANTFTKNNKKQFKVGGIPAGNYTVTVTDDFGCTATDSFFIADLDGTYVPNFIKVNNAPGCAYSPLWNTVKNQPGVIGYQASYRLADGGARTTSPQLGANDTTFTFSGLAPNTTYSFFVRSRFDTGAGTMFSPWSAPINRNTGACVPAPRVAGGNSNEVLLTENGLTIFPNPTENLVNISSSGTITEVMLFDATGKLIHRQDVDGQETVVDMFRLADGVYTLKVMEGAEIYTERIIKQ